MFSFLSVKNIEIQVIIKIEMLIAEKVDENPVWGDIESNIVPAFTGTKTAKNSENNVRKIKYLSGSWPWTSRGKIDANKKEKIVINLPANTIFPITITNREKLFHKFKIGIKSLNNSNKQPNKKPTKYIISDAWVFPKEYFISNPQIKG